MPYYIETLFGVDYSKKYKTAKEAFRARDKRGSGGVTKIEKGEEFGTQVDEPKRNKGKLKKVS